MKNALMYGIIIILLATVGCGTSDYHNYGKKHGTVPPPPYPAHRDLNPNHRLEEPQACDVNFGENLDKH